jgi:hypothetical protein
MAQGHIRQNSNAQSLCFFLFLFRHRTGSRCLSYGSKTAE